MAKCDLSIELDDPKQVHPAGGKVTGIVRVKVDKNVTTKGLVVTSCWRTHGRGNVATGETAKETLFTGEWTAGDDLEYRFELPIGHWPPSYHGNYLNIDHYVDARALIPWGFDPKASRPFLMRPTGGPETARKPQTNSAIGKFVGCFISLVIGSVFLSVFGAAAFAGKGFPLPFLILFTLVPGGAGLFFLIRHVMPRYLLGKVECEIRPDQVSPGDEVTGELIFRPRRKVNINNIKLTFTARERVISGSGSNRTTHTNNFFKKETTLMDEGVLQPGAEQRIPFKVALPSDAPYSVELSDNFLEWVTAIRIDIPRWPDWTKDLPIVVVPSGKEPIPAPRSEARPASPSDSGSGTGITFAETAQHFWDLRNEREAVEELADAVSGLTFDIEAYVERRLLYSGDEDPHVYDDGYAVWAHYTEPALAMVLYVPHDLADEFEQIGRDLWRGRGTVVGWDQQHRRLQVKLESSTTL